MKKNKGGGELGIVPYVLQVPECRKKKCFGNRSLLAFVVCTLMVINVVFMNEPDIARADTCPGAGSTIYIPQRDVEFLINGVVQQPIFQDALAVGLSMDGRMSTMGWRRTTGSMGGNVYVWANFFPSGDEFQVRVAQVTAYAAGYPGSCCYYSCVVTVGPLPDFPFNTPNLDTGKPGCNDQML